MIRSRHWFVLETLTLPQQFAPDLLKAHNFEAAGNWYLAGETYCSLYNAIHQFVSHPEVSKVTKARILARAASCFEIAQECRSSARFYESAAQEVTADGLNPQLAAELYSRAAFQFKGSLEYFFAGSALIRAAEEFGKISSNIINCSENFPPLPMSSTRSHLSGVCFEAAAIAYGKSLGNEMWSVGAYWRAGEAYSEGTPCIQAYEAYKRALNANIKYYNTLELDQLRLTIPLSEIQRSQKIDPIAVMEAALARCNEHHQQKPGDSPKSRLSTNRHMAEAYHGFNLELQAVGNTKEAGFFRAKQNDRQQQIFIAQRSYGAATQYFLWKVTSDYGESLGRWVAMCLFAILGFAGMYGGFGIISSCAESCNRSTEFFDYIYFSVITFSTLGYGDFHPVGLLGQILACLEVFCGLLMFGLLLSFVGNRFQRN